MIIIVDGYGKTKFCRELHNSIGRHQLFSMNDGLTLEELELFLLNRSRIVYPVIVITGTEVFCVEAEQRIRAVKNGEPVFRMTLSEPVI